MSDRMVKKRRGPSGSDVLTVIVILRWQQLLRFICYYSAPKKTISAEAFSNAASIFA